MRTISIHTLIVLLIALAFGGCQLTDHSEREEVSTDDVRFPASGYEDVDAGELAAIEFTTTHFDMGQVVQGAKVSHRFTFKSTGGSALVLTDVRGSCGCTVGKAWPKHPIKPGEKGEIEVVFDSEGRHGRQEKTVTVTANTTPPSTVLTLSGDVVGPANMQPVE